MTTHSFTIKDTSQSYTELELKMFNAKILKVYVFIQPPTEGT